MSPELLGTASDRLGRFSALPAGHRVLRSAVTATSLHECGNHGGTGHRSPKRIGDMAPEYSQASQAKVVQLFATMKERPP